MKTNLEKKLNNFNNKGYVVLDIDKDQIKYLKKIKKNFLTKSRNYLKNSNNLKLENFHKFNFKNNIFLNNFRLKMMTELNKYSDFKQKMYSSISPFLDKCLGPDIIVQKNLNLVIQKPHDTDRAPFHKDAPANSNYELVVWLPLVDCHKSMSMYVFDVNSHDYINNFLKKNVSHQKQEILSKKKGYLPNVKFGQVLVFWSNCFHYIPVNKEDKTRWSINLRYKNLFTKYGTKNLLDFYEILRVSPISNLLNKIEV